MLIVGGVRNNYDDKVEEHDDKDLQVVARLEGEGGALASRAGGGPGTSGVRLVLIIMRRRSTTMLRKRVLVILIMMMMRRGSTTMLRKRVSVILMMMRMRMRRRRRHGKR